MISVNEIGLSWEHELIEFSFGLGITSALFLTFGIFPLFREVLSILDIIGVNITAHVFQNQYGMSSGPDVVRFNFRKNYAPRPMKTRGFWCPLGSTATGEQCIQGQYLCLESKCLLHLTLL
jgi:hypothetical protein